jgi:hypothetical protein
MALANGTPLEASQDRHFLAPQADPGRSTSLFRKREEKRSRGTRDPIEAKRVHAQALAELGERWANLRSGPRAVSEREAHELVAPAYERWVNAHRDNPSDQKIWKSERFLALWNYHDPSKYTDLPFAQRNRQMDEDGYLDLITMEAFCREEVEELLSERGLKVDECHVRRRGWDLVHRQDTFDGTAIIRPFPIGYATRHKHMRPVERIAQFPGKSLERTFEAFLYQARFVDGIKKKPPLVRTSAPVIESHATRFRDALVEAQAILGGFRNDKSMLNAYCGSSACDL